MNTPLAVTVALCGLMLLTEAAVAAPLSVPGGSHPRLDHRVSRLSTVQVAYLISCGGCHGIEGVSAPQVVPTLRHLAGNFLCTREGRQYIVRLPDVALSSLSDRMLTEVMNWVAFDLGAPVAGGREVHPYTVAEVARLRRRPLTNTGLAGYRERVVTHLAPRCAVPAGMSAYGSGSARRAGDGAHSNRQRDLASTQKTVPGVSKTNGQP